MTPFERLQARIAAVRNSGDGRLPNWRDKKTPPTGSGETRGRAPGGSNSSAKLPDAPGREGPPSLSAPGAAVLPLFKHQVEAPLERPKTRGDCEGGPRPCPYVGCRHHNALEVSRIGTVKLVRAPEEMKPEESCSLDVADRGAHGLEAVGATFNLVKERVRQIEASALRKLAAHPALEGTPRFVGSCKARCAETGLRCRLPEHGPELQHRNERGLFVAVAPADQWTFPAQRRAAEAARRNPETMEPNNV